MNAVVCVPEISFSGGYVMWLCYYFIFLISYYSLISLPLYLYLTFIFHTSIHMCIFVYMFTFGGYIWQYELLK